MNLAEQKAQSLPAGCRTSERGECPWSERGATLVTALLAMLVLSAIGLMITITVAEEAQVALNHYEIASCLYIADAGVHFAIKRLQADPTWSGLPAPGRAVGRGRFTVAVSDSTSDGNPLPAGRKRLNIVATRANTEREVEVIAQ